MFCWKKNNFKLVTGWSVVLLSCNYLVTLWHNVVFKRATSNHIFFQYEIYDLILNVIKEKMFILTSAIPLPRMFELKHMTFLLSLLNFSQLLCFHFQNPFKIFHKPKQRVHVLSHIHIKHPRIYLIFDMTAWAMIPGLAMIYILASKECLHIYSIPWSRYSR